eukprot:Gregarina_sp_Poly_1__6981@NODE_37_length_18459_cov_169_892127_g32_i0_p2_GENE_NODE_37_length_18459_cov_169_892127_g32_i0NODE_37_length_18459_cov_169_892127_g32_i0_p2_ORF_typecomplete_len818_score102_18UCH/PF00443_29/3_9e03UCH/PF00443_29/1e48UCH_1/PF13423_6/3_9e03UCH_1/PF13423_6/9_3e15_NODE_37_length_18459_cov_169_892127_g32_i01302715480
MTSRMMQSSTMTVRPVQYSGTPSMITPSIPSLPYRKIVYNWHPKPPQPASPTHAPSPVYQSRVISSPVKVTTSPTASAGPSSATHQQSTFYQRLNSTDDSRSWVCYTEKACSTPTFAPMVKPPRQVTQMTLQKPRELTINISRVNEETTISSHTRAKLLTEAKPSNDSSSSLSPRRSTSSHYLPADPRTAAMHTSLSPRTHRGVEDLEGVLKKSSQPQRHKSKQTSESPFAQLPPQRPELQAWSGRQVSKDISGSAVSVNAYVASASKPYSQPNTNNIRRRRLMGLQNHGNTCYCNAVLQGLLSCQEFCDYWLSKKQLKSNPASEYKSDLLKTWLDFLEATYEDSSSIKEGSSDLATDVDTQQKKLLNLIRTHNPQFVPDTQADAHEFLQVLLKALSTETHKPTKPRPSTDPPKKRKSKSKSGSGILLQNTASLDVDDMDAEQASECYWRRQKHELNSEVENMWRSQFMSKLVCHSCKKVRYRFEAEYDWDIEVPSSPAKPSLLELLKDSATKEDIVEIMCPQCKIITPSTLKRTPYKLPGRYFCLQIKRFGYDRATGRTFRLNTPIALPEEDVIDFANYSCGPPDGGGGCFELIGLTMQEGSLENGHYTGLHKISDQTISSRSSVLRGQVEATAKWYLFSDESVKEAKNVKSIVGDGSAIYLLWFKRCDVGMRLKFFLPSSFSTCPINVAEPLSYMAASSSLYRRSAESASNSGRRRYSTAPQSQFAVAHDMANSAYGSGSGRFSRQSKMSALYDEVSTCMTSATSACPASCSSIPASFFSSHDYFDTVDHSATIKKKRDKKVDTEVETCSLCVAV